MLSLLWRIWYIIGPIFIFANGQILKNNLTFWSHWRRRSKCISTSLSLTITRLYLLLTIVPLPFPLLSIVLSVFDSAKLFLCFVFWPFTHGNSDDLGWVSNRKLQRRSNNRPNVNFQKWPNGSLTYCHYRIANYIHFCLKKRFAVICGRVNEHKTNLFYQKLI